MAYFGDCSLDLKREEKEIEFDAKLNGTSVDPVTGEPDPLTEEDLTIENMFGYDMAECDRWATGLLVYMLVGGLMLRAATILALYVLHRKKRV